jgi:hypothetical protein
MLAPSGGACTGGACPLGERCHQGKCIVPAGDGAACSSDFECRGACDKSSAAQQGKCAPACTRS